MLKISEIFYSLQGESTLMGLPTAFIRLTGCPLRCQYCDTSYAFKGGSKKSIEEILAIISEYQVNYVTVTGGEPLAQNTCLQLLDHLVENYIVSLETSGAIDISQVNPKVIKVIDVKTPGSKEVNKNLVANYSLLQPQDQLKFVICSREDYEWSKEFIKIHNLLGRCHILFSPSYHEITAENLSNWILTDKLNIRMQIQLHKLIWGEKPGV